MVGFHSNEKQRLSHTGYGAAGILSGALTRYLSQPLDVLKIRFQLQHEPIKPSTGNYYWSMRQASLRIFQEERLWALWKGHVPAQLLSMSYGLAQFLTFECCTKYVHLNVTVHGKPITDFVCGGVSGSVATLASMPWDTLRTRLVGQGEPKIYRGLTHATITMIRTEGFLSLYKGLFPCLLQIIPQVGVQFASFRFLTRAYWKLLPGVKLKFVEPIGSFENGDKLPLAGNLICGGLAGIIAKVVVYPLDLSKKRLQVQGFDVAREHFTRITHYSGLFDCLKRTVIEEGIRGLYKGLAPSILKAMITTGLTFTLYEELCHIFIKVGLFPKQVSHKVT